MPFTAPQRELVKSLLEPLQNRFPALQQHLPLALETKQRLPEIAAEFNVARHIIQKALGMLTERLVYQRALAAPDSMRHTLEGVPVEPVSADHRAFAQTRLDAVHAKRQQGAGPPRRPPSNPLPSTTPLTPELLQELLTMAIPGKLDLTLKINELPTVKNLGQTVAFVVQAEGRPVLVELKNKAWNTLKTTAEGYPQWVAAISGKMGAALEGGFRLENPVVQVFEKKAKPAPAETAAPVQASVVERPPTPTNSAPLPELHVPKPVIKLRKPAS
jgi:hypothetical protein